MSNIINNSKASNCAINVTPKNTNKVLSKMKMPSIPAIAVNALNILNNASYSHLQHTNNK